MQIMVISSTTVCQLAKMNISEKSECKRECILAQGFVSNDYEVNWCLEAFRVPLPDFPEAFRFFSPASHCDDSLPSAAF